MEDTDLNALRTTLKILNKVDSGLQFDAFGDEHMSSLIEKSFRVNYPGKLERVDLSREYGRHLLTISPSTMEPSKWCQLRAFYAAHQL